MVQQHYISDGHSIIVKSISINKKIDTRTTKTIACNPSFIQSPLARNTCLKLLFFSHFTIKFSCLTCDILNSLTYMTNFSVLVKHKTSCKPDWSKLLYDTWFKKQNKNYVLDAIPIIEKPSNPFALRRKQRNY